ncbi:MAG: hypothetical protein P4L36_01600 [Holophaga sp.]|nr:hypothetical protein [Holophaga sp.]
MGGSLLLFAFLAMALSLPLVMLMRHFKKGEASLPDPRGRL